MDVASSLRQLRTSASWRVLYASADLVRIGDYPKRLSGADVRNFSSVAMRVGGAGGLGSAVMPSVRWDRPLSWM